MIYRWLLTRSSHPPGTSFIQLFAKRLSLFPFWKFSLIKAVGLFWTPLMIRRAWFWNSGGNLNGKVAQLRIGKGILVARLQWRAGPCSRENGRAGDIRCCSHKECIPFLHFPQIALKNSLKMNRNDLGAIQSPEATTSACAHGLGPFVSWWVPKSPKSYLILVGWASGWSRTVAAWICSWLFWQSNRKASEMFHEAARL